LGGPAQPPPASRSRDQCAAVCAEEEEGDPRAAVHTEEEEGDPRVVIRAEEEEGDPPPSAPRRKEGGALPGRWRFCVVGERGGAWGESRDECGEVRKLSVE
jgi:hypothetical protein